MSASTVPVTRPAAAGTATRRLRLRTKVAAVTLAVAVPAFVLGPIVFPPADLGVEPTATQIPLFLLLAVGDALLLGLGVSFLVFGLPVLRQVSPDSKARAWAMYIAVGYLTVSWWPHLGMHMSSGLDLSRMLVIDYVFHVPLEISGVVLAWCSYSLFRSWRSRRPALGTSVA